MFALKLSTFSFSVYPNLGKNVHYRVPARWSFIIEGMYSFITTSNICCFSDQAEARRVKNREQRKKREERQIRKRKDLLTLTKDEEITQEA